MSFEGPKKRKPNAPLRTALAVIGALSLPLEAPGVHAGESRTKLASALNDVVHKGSPRALETGPATGLFESQEWQKQLTDVLENKVPLAEQLEFAERFVGPYTHWWRGSTTPEKKEAIKGKLLDFQSRISARLNAAFAQRQNYPDLEKYFRLDKIKKANIVLKERVPGTSAGEAQDRNICNANFFKHEGLVYGSGAYHCVKNSSTSDRKILTAGDEGIFAWKTQIASEQARAMQLPTAYSGNVDSLAGKVVVTYGKTTRDSAWARAGQEMVLYSIALPFLASELSDVRGYSSNFTFALPPGAAEVLENSKSNPIIAVIGASGSGIYVADSQEYIAPLVKVTFNIQDNVERKTFAVGHATSGVALELARKLH